MTNQERALWVAVRQLQRRLGIAAGGVPPRTHADDHGDGGSDEIDIADLGGFPGDPNLFLNGEGQFTDIGGGSPGSPNPPADGDETFTSTYATRPSPANDGDLFLPSDGFHLERDTGAAWVPWGPLFPMTIPVDGNFAWINQEGASVVATKGGIFLSTPASSVDDIRIRKKAAPSTPYTITAAVLTLIPGSGSTNNDHAGICFRQSSDGKLALFALTARSEVHIYKYTDPNNFSATYTNTGGISTMQEGGTSLQFLRLADDGVNRICSISTDGQNFVQIHSIGRTDFLTADEVGFYVASKNNTLPVGMTLLSWKEA